MKIVKEKKILKKKEEKERTLKEISTKKLK